MPDLLEFEEPIGELLKEIEALSTLEPSEERDKEIARLEGRVNAMRGDLYRNLTPWQRVQVARHPSRPTTLDYVERLFTDFVELHGDRRFADDHAIVTGTAFGQHECVRCGYARAGPAWGKWNSRQLGAQRRIELSRKRAPGGRRADPNPRGCAPTDPLIRQFRIRPDTSFRESGRRRCRHPPHDKFRDRPRGCVGT